LIHSWYKKDYAVNKLQLLICMTLEVVMIKVKRFFYDLTFTIY